MRRLALFLILAAVAAGPGATAATKPPFRVTFTATTHTPKVNRPWSYVVRITDLHGKPIPALVHLQVLFAGRVVGQAGMHHVVGVWRETTTFPPRAIGVPLVWQTVVTAKGGTVKIDYWIKTAR